MSLTDIQVRNAKPQTKPVKLVDGHGLFLLVTPKGQKWWRLRYRFAGKENMLSLGVYPETGLKDARERRDKTRALIAKGANPSDARKAEKAAERGKGAETFEVIAREWFAGHSQNWSDSYIRKV